MSTPELSLPFRSGERINLSSAEVLLIDSQPESLEVLAEMFAGFGVHTPHRATNMVEARQAIADRTINLIVVSNVVTGGDGCGFIKWLRRAATAPNRFAPVILLTGHTREAEVFKGRDCGANFVLRKPASPMIMMQRILWISRDQREFVEAPNYCGPDRRFKMLGPPDGVQGRRHDDLSANVGEAKTPNLDQGDIDALFQPRRAM
jgi:DNA-binding response OmpR family regulator